MAHDIRWLNFPMLLYVNYRGHQTQTTLNACLDDIAAELDQVERPAMILIDWREVTKTDLKILLNARGHRAYSHPMAARGVLVGMDKQTRFENEVSAVKTRDSKNTQYYETMAEALDYLQNFLDGVDITTLHRELQV